MITLAEFAELKGSPSQTRLDQAVSNIRAACGWHIAPVLTETVTLDGPGRSVLLLPSLRVTDVASVTENGRELVEGTDYEWSAKGTLRRRCGWTDRYRGIVVEFTHGGGRCSVTGGFVAPAELVALIFDVATSAAAVPVGQQPEKIGPFEFGGAAGVQFDSSQQRIIDRYTIGNAPA
jgi:hypothetical protein